VFAVSDDAPIEQADPAPFGGSVEGSSEGTVEPDPVRWELPEPTGVAAVDEALTPLVELDELPTGEHVAHYEAVHRRLQDALADLDSA